MPTTRQRWTNSLPTCPHCWREPTFVSTWSFRGVWGYNEVHTYECSEHGPIFISSQRPVEHVTDQRRDKDPDNLDRDALVPSPRKRPPTLNADSIAVPEPDSA